MRRIYHCFTLLVFVAGCSGLHEVPLAIDAPATPLPGEVGRRARVTLDDGSRHEGEVARVSDAEIVLAKVGNYGKEETTFPRERIVRVEVEKATWLENSLAWGGLGLMAGAVVLGLWTLAILQGIGG